MLLPPTLSLHLELDVLLTTPFPFEPTLWFCWRTHVGCSWPRKGYPWAHASWGKGERALEWLSSSGSGRARP